jgi:50S ribosomal protein L16 3-hydroxylase
MLAFARDAVERAQRDPQALAMLLGEVLTEPKPQVWFEPGAAAADCTGGVRLDRRTRMMYDAHFVFINGDSYRASGRDARLLRQLADERSLPAAGRGQLGAQAQALLAEWIDAGWAHDD